MRKFIFLLLSASSLLLIGCGGGASSATEGTSSTPSNAIPAGGDVNAPATAQ